jgi:hypothetical protein
MNLQQNFYNFMSSLLPHHILRMVYLRCLKHSYFIHHKCNNHNGTHREVEGHQQRNIHGTLEDNKRKFLALG